jgi:serine/threonine-protein kinase ATR
VLQARQWEAPYSYVQSCKLIRASGEALRALQELDNALPWSVSDDIVLDLSDEDLGEDSEDRKMKAKVSILCMVQGIISRIVPIL